MFVSNPYAKQGRPPQPSDTAVLRECSRHGLVVFHRYSAGGGRYSFRCKRCVGEAVTRRHRELKRLLVEENGGCCAVCGYDRCVGNLHFHHVDPATRAFSMATGGGLSIAAYREEALKCVLVCANCHGEIEAGLIPSPPAGAKLAG